MYKRLTRLHIRVELASSAYLGVRYYLKNYFVMYKRLTRLRIPVELASPACLGLGIIKIFIMPTIHV